MDDEELDTWYEEEKEKITSEYRKNIGKSEKSEIYRKKYDKAFADLHRRYELKSKKKISLSVRNFFIKHRIKMITDRLLIPIKKFKEKLDFKKKGES